MGALAGLGAFALYFIISLAFLLIFKFVYLKVTPYDEIKLIREEQNMAAAVALSGSLIGYCLAIASAASNSVSILDFTIWSVVALAAQIIAYLLVRFVIMPKIVERIENNELPAGVLLGATSVCVGLLNAACMTY